MSVCDLCMFLCLFFHCFFLFVLLFAFLFVDNTSSPALVRSLMTLFLSMT